LTNLRLERGRGQRSGCGWAAGRAAAAAARRLLLTHFWPDNDRQASRAAAAAAFRGDILLAEEALEVPLG